MRFRSFLAFVPSIFRYARERRTLKHLQKLHLEEPLQIDFERLFADAANSELRS